MFEVPAEPPYRRPERRSAITLHGLFWTQLASTTLGILLACLIMFLGLRALAIYFAAEMAKAMEEQRIKAVEKRP